MILAQLMLGGLATAVAIDFARYMRRGGRW